jgi:DNA-binding MarR family transcriptional regulator
MPETRWLDESEQRTWRTLLRHQVYVLDRLDSEMAAAFGISLADYEILVHLSEAPDRRLRMAELADGALVSRSRLTHRVDALVDAGLVERQPCPTDRRGTYAVLTRKGRNLLERAAPTHVDSVRRYVIDPLRRSTQKALVDELGPALAELERGRLTNGCPEAG